MKMKGFKFRGLALLMSAIMLTTLIPMTAHAETISGDGYSFNTETGELHIANEAGSTAWRNDASIPKEAVKSVTLQRLDTPVINIGDNAFEGCVNLTGTIQINAYATSIGKDAFKGCDNIDLILIPKAAEASIAEAGISADTAYVVYEFDQSNVDGNGYNFVVCDVVYGSLNQIVYDGVTVAGTTLCHGNHLVCNEEYNVIPTDGYSAWYYTEGSEGITITKYVPNSYAGQIKLPTTLAGKTVVGYSDTAFSDEKLDASYIFIFSEGTNVSLPDNVSKCIIKEENGVQVAYLTQGTEGALDLWNVNLGRDVSTIYAKNVSVSDVGGMQMNTIIAYTENENGTITITDVSLSMDDMHTGAYTVPTSIDGKTVTSVVVNQMDKPYIDGLVIDSSANVVIYQCYTHSESTDTPVIVKVVQGSGQDSVEIPSEFYGRTVAEVTEDVFDESVDCVVVKEGTTVNTPDTVSKITYTIEDGNVVVTDVTAGTDSNGGQKTVTIPEIVGGSEPIMSEEAKEDMQDIPHEHSYENGVCSDCGDIQNITMQIFCKVEIDGEIKYIALVVEQADTIEEVKEIIYEKTGYPTSQQILTFNEVILEDSKTLLDYAVKKDGTLELEVNADIEIREVAVNVDAPCGGQPFDTTAECNTTGIESVSVKWTDTGHNDVTGNAQFGWSYIAHFTFTPMDGYVFGDSVEVSFGNSSITVENLEVNDDGTLYVKSYDVVVSDAKITGAEVPTAPAQFGNEYATKAEVLASTELPSSVTVNFEDGSTKTMSIEWSMDGEYDAIAGANNTFKWSIKQSELDGYTVADGVTLNGTVTIQNNPSQAVQPEPEPVDYEIIAGANGKWTVGSDSSLTITGDGDFDKFTGVKVDGEFIDSSNYTAVSGSTVITLSGAYLKTLTEGTHTFEIVWTDGSASTQFTIEKKADTGNTDQDDDDDDSDDPNTNNGDNTTNNNNNNNNANTDKKDDVLKTGDNTPIVWLFVLMIVSGMGVVLTARKKKVS